MNQEIVIIGLGLLGICGICQLIINRFKRKKDEEFIEASKELMKGFQMPHAGLIDIDQFQAYAIINLKVAKIYKLIFKIMNLSHFHQTKYRNELEQELSTLKIFCIDYASSFSHDTKSTSLEIIEHIDRGFFPSSERAFHPTDLQNILCAIQKLRSKIHQELNLETLLEAHDNITILSKFSS